MPDAQKQMVVRWFEEVWNQGREETIDELLSADCVIHDGESDARGPEGFKPFFERMRKSFSQINVTCHESITEGDRTCLRWSATMLHTGNGLGVPATGKPVRISGMSMMRFANGRFAEAWQNWDALEMMEQIRATEAAKFRMGHRHGVSDAAGG